MNGNAIHYVPNALCSDFFPRGPHCESVLSAAHDERRPLADRNVHVNNVRQMIQARHRTSAKPSPPGTVPLHRLPRRRSLSCISRPCCRLILRHFAHFRVGARHAEYCVMSCVMMIIAVCRKSASKRAGEGECTPAKEARASHGHCQRPCWQFVGCRCILKRYSKGIYRGTPV